MKRLKYCILGLLAAFSLGFYSCQNDDVSDPNKTDDGVQTFKVTELLATKGATPITGGTGTYKTGRDVRVTAAYGATISATRVNGSGTASRTYQDASNNEAYIEINDIHGDWNVSADLTYTVNVTAGTGGTASGGGSVDPGKSCNISATANSGYSFNGWTVSPTGAGTFGSSSSASTTFSPTADCTVTANFKEEKSYNISISVVSVASGSQGARIDNYTITGPVIRDGSNIGSHSVNERNLPAGTYQVTVGSSFLRDNAWEYPRYVNVTPQNFTLSENNTSQFVLVTISDSPISGDR